MTISFLCINTAAIGWYEAATIYENHAFYLRPNNSLKAFGKAECNWQVHIYGYLTNILGITLNVNLVHFILSVRRSIFSTGIRNCINCITRDYVLQRMSRPERCCWKMLVCCITLLHCSPDILFSSLLSLIQVVPMCSEWTLAFESIRSQVATEIYWK